MSLTTNTRIVALARRVVAWPNRQVSLRGPSGSLMRGLARVAIRRTRATPARDLPELFAQWQRCAPALADYRLADIRDETVFAEVHSPCALRGTGDLGACYRMMEYDREVMRAVGGELVILESQAAPDRTSCRVALRRRGAATDDLIPVYTQEPRGLERADPP